MKYCVVIDTNVLVSALLKRNSIPSKIIELIFDDIVVPILNESVLQEYKAVLNRPKFHFPQELVNSFIVGIEGYGHFTNSEPLKINEVEFPDPDDWKFYELLIQNRKFKETYLVTGNTKHFPDEPFIVTPRQLFEIISRKFNEL